MTVTARHVSRDPVDPGREIVVSIPAELEPVRTAALVCDMWDLHWCEAATRRVAELAPAIDRLARDLRRRGVLVVHAPSDTLDRYRDHPARRRALEAAKGYTPAPPAAWMGHDHTYEGAFPVDDTDQGCWCSPPCAQRSAWTSQIATIAIEDEDIITDSGEVYGVYERRGIDTVIVMGVHTNMCVLGRPFGIRQSVRRGYRVFLVRDLSDTMYNPARRPWVDHFTGTDLVVRHIETYWCPTITSDQFTGDRPFRFAEDRRTLASSG